jgi:hypothetical protein
MTDARVTRPEPSTGLETMLLELVAGGQILVGTIATLSAALGVSGTDLRTSLRGLLEAERIAVHTGPTGQLMIRLERRTRRSLPPLVERRRPAPDFWVL